MRGLGHRMQVQRYFEILEGPSFVSLQARARGKPSLLRVRFTIDCLNP